MLGLIMENQIRKIEKTEKKAKVEIVNLKIKRAYIIAESGESILLSVNEYKVWINKKFVYADQYTLNGRLGIIKDSIYKGIDNEGDDVEIPSNLLIQMIESSPAYIPSVKFNKNVEISSK